TPDVLTDATADMAWALLFAVARRVVESDAVMRSGRWGGWGPLQFIGGDITGATLGIIGAGRIGAAMARKSRGFDMKVLYCDGFRNEALEAELGARRVELDELLSASDYVSVHVPLMPETRHLINASTLKKMKPTAYLINTARGPIVDEAALVDALRTGTIAGAGLDVYEAEPKMAPGLAELPNVVITPHVASATKRTRDDMATLAARNLIAMVEGSRPETCINPEIYG
ncbi:MAG: D-glycerate dehydrogenase, partial [Spirochaetaceae bacterium]